MAAPATASATAADASTSSPGRRPMVTARRRD
jgi:hypothetical protein